MSRPTHLEIDATALQHNLSQVKANAPQAAVLAMVKANAYGHGVKQVAMALASADAFGVACMEEALQMINGGVSTPIVLMEGFFSKNELPLIVEKNIEIVVHNHKQLKILEESRLPANAIKIWLKIDTGMHRLGFMPEEVSEVWQRLKASQVVNPTIKLLSHLAAADDLSLSVTNEQLTRFKEITSGLPGPKSLANSAAILAWKETHFDWVRPGIMLYGVSPFANKIGRDHGLLPVMTLYSELIAIRKLKKGAAVGYGGTWICPEDMLVGVIAIGYGDGYPRQAKNGTPISLNNKIVPLIGRVSMDMITVDLREQPNARIGDKVILWGKELPIELVAHHTDTSAYELLCRMTERIIRGK